MPAADELLEYTERPRAHGWSLRSALTRYAQGQPQRVSDVLQLVRRIEAAYASHASDGLRDCIAELDRLGDVLAEWAGDPAGPTGDPPHDEVDATTADVARRLHELGIPHEERPARRGPPSRG
jgi:hypothetical protein